jgi:hypothetical protein
VYFFRSVAVFMAWARQFVQENEQSSDASKLFGKT